MTLQKTVCCLGEPVQLLEVDMVEARSDVSDAADTITSHHPFQEKQQGRGRLRQSLQLPLVFYTVVSI